MARSKNQWTLMPENCGTGSDSLALFGNDPNSVPGDSLLDGLAFPINQIDFAIHDFFAVGLSRLSRNPHDYRRAREGRELPCRFANACTEMRWQLPLRITCPGELKQHALRIRCGMSGPTNRRKWMPRASMPNPVISCPRISHGV